MIVLPVPRSAKKKVRISVILIKRKLPTDYSSDKQREKPDQKACKRLKNGYDSTRALNPQPSTDHVRQRAQSAR